MVVCGNFNATGIYRYSRGSYRRRQTYTSGRPERCTSGRPKREPYLEQSVNSGYRKIPLAEINNIEQSFRRFLLASAKHKAVPWHFKHYRARCKATHGKCQSLLGGKNLGQAGACAIVTNSSDTKCKTAKHCVQISSTQWVASSIASFNWPPVQPVSTTLQSYAKLILYKVCIFNYIHHNAIPPPSSPWQRQVDSKICRSRDEQRTSCNC